MRVLSRPKGVNDVKDMGDGKFEISCKVGADRSAEKSALAVEGGWPLHEFRPIGMTLEDIFLQLTMKEDEERHEGVPQMKTIMLIA